MTTTFKVLGQVAPTANNSTVVYTVPAATQAVISTLAIANLGVSTTYRIAVRPAGMTLEAKNYIAYDVAINANDSVMLTLGITLAATDLISIYAGAANVSFSLFGSEIA